MKNRVLKALGAAALLTTALTGAAFAGADDNTRKEWSCTTRDGGKVGIRAEVKKGEFTVEMKGSGLDDQGTAVFELEVQDADNKKAKYKVSAAIEGGVFSARETMASAPASLADIKKVKMNLCAALEEK